MSEPKIGERRVMDYGPTASGTNDNRFHVQEYREPTYSWNAPKKLPPMWQTIAQFSFVDDAIATAKGQYPSVVWPDPQQSPRYE